MTVVAGFVVALAVIALCGLGGFLFGRSQVARAKRGWNLVPVVVATRDLPVGTVLQPGDLRSSTAPEQFVTPRIVINGAGLEGQRLLAPLAKGESLHAGHLNPPPSFERTCLIRATATATSLGVGADPAVATLLKQLEQKVGP